MTYAGNRFKPRPWPASHWLRAFLVAPTLLLGACDGNGATDPNPDADATHRVRFIGSIDGLTTVPQGLNQKGEVVGNAYGAEQGPAFGKPFFWKDGNFTSLQSVATNALFAWSINDRSEVIVQARTNTGCPNGWEAFVWRPSGAVTNVGCGVPRHIDEQGRVLLGHGALWENGQTTQLPFDHPVHRVDKINARGEVIGFFSVPGCRSLGGQVAPGIMRNGKVDILPCREFLTDLNDQGWAVGFPEGNQAGFLIRPEGRTGFEVPGGFFRPHSVNNAGEVLGIRAAPADTAAAIWRNGAYHTIRPQAPWIVTHVVAITDNGLILAQGRNSETGEKGGLLLTPWTR